MSLKPIERSAQLSDQGLEELALPANFDREADDLALRCVRFQRERAHRAVGVCDLKDAHLQPLSDADVKRYLAIGEAALHQAIHGGPGPLGAKKVG